MVKYKKSHTYYRINNHDYFKGEIIGEDIPTNTLFNFYSIDNGSYPSIEYHLEKIQFAYRTAVVTQYKNYNDLIVDVIDDKGYTIKIQYGHPLLSDLGATKDDKGYWFYYVIPKNENIKLWEERYSVDGFQFPEDLTLSEEIDMETIEC